MFEQTIAIITGVAFFVWFIVVYIRREFEPKSEYANTIYDILEFGGMAASLMFLFVWLATISKLIS